MTPDELRLVKIMAFRIRRYAERLRNEMNFFITVTEVECQSADINSVVERFGHDSGFGVLDITRSIESVVNESLPALKGETKNEFRDVDLSDILCLTLSMSPHVKRHLERLKIKHEYINGIWQIYFPHDTTETTTGGEVPDKTVYHLRGTSISFVRDNNKSHLE